MKFIESLDHPFLFVVFVSMAVWGFGNLVKAAADRYGLFGLKSAVPQ